MKQYNTGTSNYDNSTTVNQVLARHVTGLTFVYRKNNDQPYAIGTDQPKDIRTTKRAAHAPRSRLDTIGFRVARED